MHGTRHWLVSADGSSWVEGERLGIMESGQGQDRCPQYELPLIHDGASS